MTTSSPLHVYFVDCYAEELRRSASVVMDQARTHWSRMADRADDTGSRTRTRIRADTTTTTAVVVGEPSSYSPPPPSPLSGRSLGGLANLSRWESSGAKTKTHTPSPPPRQPRRLSPSGSGGSSPTRIKAVSPIPMRPRRVSMGHSHSHPPASHPSSPMPPRLVRSSPPPRRRESLSSLPGRQQQQQQPRSERGGPTMDCVLRVVESCPSSASSLQDAALLKYRENSTNQSPHKPSRRGSSEALDSLPRPPLWEHRSPDSVRAGLHEILGRALDECNDGSPFRDENDDDNDYGRDASSTMAVA